MEKYRPNVAALLVNSEGKLLICERLDIAGAWQFPQGGVDPGEDPDEAIVREVWEEVGLSPGDYEIEESRSGYRYRYPPEVRQGKPPHKADFAGQEQTYYLCRLSGENPQIDLEGEAREFARSRWIRPEEFDFSWLPDFKKAAYRAVMEDFFGVTNRCDDL